MAECKVTPETAENADAGALTNPKANQVAPSPDKPRASRISTAVQLGGDLGATTLSIMLYGFATAIIMVIVYMPFHSWACGNVFTLREDTGAFEDTDEGWFFLYASAAPSVVFQIAWFWISTARRTNIAVCIVLDPDSHLHFPHCSSYVRPFSSNTAKTSTGSKGSCAAQKGFGASRSRCSSSPCATSRCCCPPCGATRTTSSNPGKASRCTF